jgi:hypothetical protein
MPEFILDMGSAGVARDFNKLPAFVRGYIEAMFFTDTNYGDGEEGEGIDEAASVADLAPESLADIIADCEAFEDAASPWLEFACEFRGYDEEQAGRDFWYTRNGHGTGFWDRRQLDGVLGETLTSFCGSGNARARGTWFGEVYTCTGDDGLIYLN